MKEIWEHESIHDIGKASRMVAMLPENQIDVGELENILRGLFEEDINILVNMKAGAKSDIKRLIKIYDCLKYGTIWKQKEPSD